MLLALISWNIITRYISTCMEATPISYQLYRTFFLDDAPSLFSTYRTIRSFLKQRRLRSWLAMLFIAFTMIFILAFPTITSALSGYDSNISAFVLDRNDNLIPLRKFARAAYMIHDGGRLENLFDDYIVEYHELSYCMSIGCMQVWGTKAKAKLLRRFMREGSRLPAVQSFVHRNFSM